MENKGEIQTFTSELDGKPIAWSSETMFYIEVGRGKGSYKVRNAIKGNLAQACLIYRGINIGNGYKKRLSMDDKVLGRHTS
jgi:hypothetical protein